MANFYPNVAYSRSAISSPALGRFLNPRSFGQGVYDRPPYQLPNWGPPGGVPLKRPDWPGPLPSQPSLPDYGPMYPPVRSPVTPSFTPYEPDKYLPGLPSGLLDLLLFLLPLEFGLWWSVFQLWKSLLAQLEQSFGAGSEYPGFVHTAHCNNPKVGPRVRESYSGLIGGFTPRHAAVGACTTLSGQSADQPPAPNTLGIVEAVHTNSGSPFFTPQTQWIDEWCRPSGGTQPYVWSYPNRQVKGVPYPYGQPGDALTPGQIASIAPLLQPQIGVQPETVPWNVVPQLNQIAQSQASPWVQREVGPELEIGRIVEWSPYVDPEVSPELEPSTAPSPSPLPPPMVLPPSQWGYDVQVSPWTPPQVAPMGSPRTSFQPGPKGPEDEQNPTRNIADPNDTGSPRVRFERPEFAPPRKGTRERKLRVPKKLIHLLAATTWAGCFIRALFESLPKSAKSKMHRNPVTGKYGKRRYDSMLKDIYNHMGQIDWGKFGILAGECVIKYRLEGKLLATANRLTQAFGNDYIGYGVGTNLMHTSGGIDPTRMDNPHGGIWNSARSPFGGIDELQQRFNAAVGANTYHPNWSFRGG